MKTRSQHISIQVQPDLLDKAVRYYAQTLGLVPTKSADGSVKFVGENFTLWIDPSQEPAVLQEWFVGNLDETKRKLVEAGAEVTAESDIGFFVRDPYGMRYHVCSEND